MIDTGDILLELTAEEPSDKWHQCLKSSKIETNDECLFAHSEPLTDGDCKSVHCQSDAHQDEFNK